MTAQAKSFLPAESDSSLATVLATLASHEDKQLVIEYSGRRIQPGYHVTEVKAGSFVTLDCGGNPDVWEETILQVEDLPAENGQTFMTVGKFRSILAQVNRRVALNEAARLTFEIGPPEAPMQIYDVARVAIDQATVMIQLGPRAAICKPRHRATNAAKTARCGSGTNTSTKSACCA
jgi:Family of unknown function (DUF6428)